MYASFCGNCCKNYECVLQCLSNKGMELQENILYFTSNYLYTYTHRSVKNKTEEQRYPDGGTGQTFPQLCTTSKLDDRFLPNFLSQQTTCQHLTCSEKTHFIADKKKQQQKESDICGKQYFLNDFLVMIQLHKLIVQRYTEQNCGSQQCHV